MQVPKTLKIGGHEVKVIYQEWAANNFGVSDTVPSKIYINSSACESQQASTVLHEIIENINSNCDLQLNHTQVSTLETVLYQVLKDNKLHFDE